MPAVQIWSRVEHNASFDLACVPRNKHSRTYTIQKSLPRAQYLSMPRTFQIWFTFEDWQTDKNVTFKMPSFSVFNSRGILVILYAIHIAQLDLKQGQKRKKKRQIQIDTRIPISSYNHVLLSWQFLSGWTSYSLNCPLSNEIRTTLLFDPAQ